jgi:hypothetical protein
MGHRENLIDVAEDRAMRVGENCLRGCPTVEALGYTTNKPITQS